MFELLAPAGSPDIFRAVLAAGADAVYLGGKSFGARAHAENFSPQEILDAIDYAHLNGRKVYLTVNTLLKNQEIDKELYPYLLPLYKRGLDAVLVQDMGVFSLIGQAFPDLPVHISTQMTATGAEAAALFTELGARRIVMARETSLAELKAVHALTQAELEVFVHGALCYCYSGQCLFSSMLGGRSGNRGRCAQPCRLPYTVSGETGEKLQSRSYVLSLKDLCGIEYLHELHEAGVYSLKIEGRMKDAAYAAGVVSYYRSYIDLYMERQAKGTADPKLQISRKDREGLLSLGNRCGFTDGYLKNRPDANMVTFQKPGYEKENLSPEMLEKLSVSQQRLKARGHLTLHVGQKACYKLVSDAAEAEAVGPEVLPAQKKPLNKEEVTDRMKKTGGTFFGMEAVTVDMDENVFLPNGALNQLRRDALDLLLDRHLQMADLAGRRSFVPAPGRIPPGWGIDDRKAAVFQGGGERKRVICLTEKRELLEVILEQPFVTTVYLDAGAYTAENIWQALKEDADLCREAGREVCFAMPRIFRQRTSERYLQHLRELAELALDGIVVRSYEEFYFVTRKLPEPAVVIDHNLYTFNDYAVRAFAALGAARNTVPLELNAGEIAHRDNAFSEMIVYGYYPLMTSAQCLKRNTKGCDKSSAVTYLTDRFHKRFPAKNYCADCYNVIYNSLPVLLFSKLPELKDAGIHSFRMDFTVETKEETREILMLYREFAGGRMLRYPESWQRRYTGGHYSRGVD
ncbi:MAG: U32 family peptidase [Blautia sp.]|nr:U32 family peptidase [Blautia sp.]